MNRHQGSYHYNIIDDRPMLGAVNDYLQETESNHSLENDADGCEYNVEEEKVAKQLLDDFEDLFPKTSEISVKKCESPKDNHHDGPLPLWYKRKLESKIREAKDRLELLSNIVCNYCPTAAAHIKRIEQDHSATFCKMDFPRHPSLNKPWTNSWKFNCAVKCKDTGNPTHSHTSSCKSQVVLEHVDTGVSMATPNICANEYPKFVMDVVELFQDFANEHMKKASDAASESTVLAGIKFVVRSNYKNELMIVVRGKKIGSLKYQLRKFFDSGPGRYSDVISVSCIDQTWRKNMSKVDAEHIHGFFELKDKIGSLSIEYKPKITVDFNSIEVAQLAQIIKDYAGLTMETTLLDIGCSFGVLSLMMSDECERVIGLNTMHSFNNELNQAEGIKRLNRIENVSFIGCNPENLITQCSPLVKGYITVAVVNLATPYGKSKYTMDALRNIPSIWRVIAYGPYTKEHRTNIVKLTTENDTSGDHFSPMQGCILDKSPSAENAFDIIILFERTSLITPKLKLEVLASGPTVNVKIDSEAGKYEPLNVQELKPKLSVDRNQNLQNAEEKYRKSPPYSSSSHSSRRFNRSPSPKRSFRSPSPKRSIPSPSPKRSQRSSSPRRSNRSPSPKRSIRSPSPKRSQRSSSPRRSNRSPSSTRSQRSSSPRRSQRSSSPRRSQRSSSPRRSQRSPSPRRSTTSDRHSDRSVHKHKSHPVPPVHKEKDTIVYPPTINEFRVKSEPTEDRLPSRNKNRSPSSSANEKSFDYPKSEKNKLHEERRDKTIPISYPLLSVRKEFQFSCPTPPREKPPSPPANTSLDIDASQIKEEEDAGWNIPSWTTVITDPEPLQDKEESALSSNNDGIPINSVTVVSTFSANSSDISYENIPLPMIVKSEPTDSYEMPSQLVTAEDVLQPAAFNIEPADRHDISSQFVNGENVVIPVTIKSEPPYSYEVPLKLATSDIPLPVSVNSEPADRHDVHIQFETGEKVFLPVTVKSEPVDPQELPYQLMTGESLPKSETFISEPVDSHDVPIQHETGESVPSTVTVKSEPMDSSQLATDENVSQSIIIKSETVDSFKVPAQLVKNEPQAMEISPNVEDIQNMETPIHNPRPVDSSTKAVLANLDGFEFSLDATKSYMTLPRDPVPLSATFSVKTEAVNKEHLEANEEIGEKNSSQQIEKNTTKISNKMELEEGERVDTDEEIKIIDEKKIDSKANINIVKTEPKDDDIEIVSEKRSEQQTESKPKIRVKTEGEIKVKNEVEENDDDLRTLIEERKKLLEKLGRDKEARSYKDLPRSYKRHSSPSPSSCSSRKYNKRSPSSSSRSTRSPSLYRHRSPSSKRRRRSPYRSRRPPSPNYRRSRRSPTSPVRVKREPYSPDRSKREPFSSVSNKRGDRSKRSPSTSSFKREVYGRTSRKRSRSKSPKRRKSPSRS